MQLHGNLSSRGKMLKYGDIVYLYPNTQIHVPWDLRILFSIVLWCGSVQGVVTTHANMRVFCQPQVTSTGPRISLTERVACECKREFFPVVTEGVCVHCMANEKSLCLLQSALLDDSSFSLLDFWVFSLHGFFLDTFEGAYKPINMSVRIKEGIVPKPTKLL